MFNFKKKKSPIVTVKELAKQVKLLEERLEKTTNDLTALTKQQEQSVSKVGVVRFNPFEGIGGDQSFSVALLNSENSGVVFTSHYGKDMQRVYAKEVKKGKSTYPLSAEEEKIILQAQDVSKKK
ncbi:MAG: DUF4446 family protein [bacterium]|nr:DUF4446 family protein [bacterium]